MLIVPSENTQEASYLKTSEFGFLNSTKDESQKNVGLIDFRLKGFDENFSIQE